jgi:hypothetical protein
MCCSSSRWTAAGCTWSGSPPIWTGDGRVDHQQAAGSAVRDGPGWFKRALDGAVCALCTSPSSDESNRGPLR